MMLNIGVIGGGNMGEAIIAGAHKQHKVFVCEISFRRRSYLKNKYRCQCGDLETLLAKSDYVVLAIKPQDFEGMLTQIAAFDVMDIIFISIAAGVPTRKIERLLEQDVSVIRAMPNMPAMIGEGVTGIAGGQFSRNKEVKEAAGILSGLGKTVVVQERQIDAITAVSGSGPAYVFYFVECMTKAARGLGLNSKQADELVMSTLLGSAHMLAESKESAEQLRRKVTSKGGTTQAALEVLTDAKVDKVFQEAFRAARDRAKELAK